MFCSFVGPNRRLEYTMSLIRSPKRTLFLFSSLLLLLTVSSQALAVNEIRSQLVQFDMTPATNNMSV